MEHLLTDPTFWVATGFALFMLAVFKPAAKTITGALDSRTVRIQEELDRAVQLREEAEALLATYQRQSEEALAQAEAIVTKANADAAAYGEQMEQELKAAMVKRRQMAEQKIAQAETQAVQEVRQHIADIAVSTARELVIQRIAAGQGDDLVRYATTELQRKLH